MSMEVPTPQEQPRETSADIVQFPQLEPEIPFRELPHKEQIKRLGSACVAMVKAAFTNQID